MSNICRLLLKETSIGVQWLACCTLSKVWTYKRSLENSFFSFRFFLNTDRKLQKLKFIIFFKFDVFENCFNIRTEKHFKLQGNSEIVMCKRLRWEKTESWRGIWDEKMSHNQNMTLYCNPIDVSFKGV